MSVKDMGAVIKSIQKGSTAITGTSSDQSITAVDLEKTFLVFSIRSSGFGGNVGAKDFLKGELTTTTNINFERAVSTDGVVAEWFVIEFESGVSVQRETFTSTTSSVDRTINSVDVNKSFVVGSHKLNTGSGSEVIADYILLISNTLTNATTVNVRRTGGNSTYSADCHYQVIEFI